MSGLPAVCHNVQNDDDREYNRMISPGIESLTIMDSTAKTQWHGINLNLLPIKVHYFIWFAALSGVCPFMPLLAKSLGISATATGLTYTVLPFFILLFKPLIGFLADYFRNLKGIIVILIVITCCSCLSMLFITKIETEPIFRCAEANNTASLKFGYDAVCFENDEEANHLLDNILTCQLNCSAINESERSNVHDVPYLAGIFPDVVLNASANFQGKKLFITFEKDLETNSVCHCLSESLNALSCKPPLDSCITELNAEDSSSVFTTYQFWVFTLLATLAGTASSIVGALSDAACCEILGDKTELYGRQRLCGTISWGVTVLLVGYINDLASVGNHPNYSPGFYLMGGLLALHLAVLSRITIPKAKISTQICRDIGGVFASCEIVIFAMGVFVMGAMSALLSNYHFWYLQNLGASQTLLGLTLTVQCLAAETPFFFFSGWVIRKLGHFYCLSACQVAFGLRFGLYYVLQNPWLMLPVEVLHGLTFGLFYSTMISYSGHKSLPGTEATTLGVFGALYSGLGVGVGSLLGGMGFDRIGGRGTFLTASCVSSLCAPAILIVQACLARTSNHKKEIIPQMETIDT